MLERPGNGAGAMAVQERVRSERASSAAAPAVDRRLLRGAGIIGTIAAPASAVAAVAQLTGLSADLIALSFVVTFAAAALLIFRRPVDRRAPASLFALALLLAAPACFLAGAALTRSGAAPTAGAGEASVRPFASANDYLDADGLPSLGDSIRNADKEIWFYGVAFHISAGDRVDDLLGALRRGVSLRYMIFDCSGPHLADVARSMAKTEDSVRVMCASGVQFILDLQQAWAAERGDSLADVHVRLYSEAPHARAYLFDPGQDRASGYFVPYITGVDPAVLPGYFLSDRNMVERYAAGLRKLWPAGRPLEGQALLQPSHASGRTAR